MQKKDQKDQKNRSTPRRPTVSSSSRNPRELKVSSQSFSSAKAQPQSKAAPIAISSRLSAYQGNPSGQRWKVSGRDFITTVTVPSTGLAVGQTVVSQIISPVEFSSTRLSILSELYDNWEVVRMKFIYEPAVATTTAGQICGYIDRDSTDAFLSISDENIRKAASHPSFSANSVWSPNS